MNFTNPALKKIEEKIEEVLLNNVEPSFHNIVRYQVNTKGKRLRSKLALISSKMLGGKERDILYPAAGLEILHNYTLIIDDIIDEGILRRKKATTWKKFGKSIAECVSMYYGTAVFETALKSKKPSQISNLFAKTLKILVNGEIRDILFEQAGRQDEEYIKKNRYSKIKKEDYLKMISEKTAVFIESSCKIGAICADGTKEETRKLGNYGFNLGMAFQVSDDLLDIFGNEKKFGKKRGKDIEERKGGNGVIYFAFEEFSSKEKERFLKILKKDKITEKEIEEAIKMIEKTDARKKTIECGNDFIRKAKKSLSSLPQNKWNKILFSLADGIMEREK